MHGMLQSVKTQARSINGDIIPGFGDQILYGFKIAQQNSSGLEGFWKVVHSTIAHGNVVVPT